MIVTKLELPMRWMLALLAAGFLAWSIYETLTSGAWGMAPILIIFGWIGLTAFVLCVAPLPWTARWPARTRVVSCILTFPSTLWTYFWMGLPLPFWNW